MDDIQRNGFHSHGGLYFRRGSDGSVTVYAEQPGEVTLTPHAWASIVASVSAGGEGHYSHASALNFHQGSHDTTTSSQLLPKRGPMTTPTPAPTPVATQTRHPWRATVRTVFAGAVGACSLLPEVASAAHIGTVPTVVQILAVTGAVTRVLALPGVETWLRTYVPWLAAAPQEVRP